MSQHQPVGGRVLALPVLIFGTLTLVALWILAQRFAFGLGAVTNLNNGYPWGVWIYTGIMLLMSLGLFFWLRRRKWF